MAAVLLTLAAVPVVQQALHANAGVFFGDGHTVRLDHSAEIQMVSEDVLIEPGRGRTLFGGGIPMDWVDYTCRFELRNLTDGPVEVQVGFPLTAMFHDYTPASQFDEQELVEQYRFLARDRDRTYHTRFVARDEEKRFRRLFLWTMTFAPQETRVLHVSYGMPMSFSLNTTVRSPLLFDCADWLFDLTTCLEQTFGYVTETGASWAGKIERARFRVRTASFEAYLAQRGWTELPPKERDASAPPNPFDFDYPVLWHRAVAPAGAKDWTDGDQVVGLEWELAPFQPGPEFRLSYYVTQLPRRPADMRRFASSKAEAGADLTVLREIVAAWFGVPPENAEAAEFVAGQVWDHRAPAKTAAELRPEEAELLRAICEGP